MDTQGKQLEDHTPQWTMLTQQDIQDMLLEFKLIKMKVHLMLDKEITRLRKTKLKPSQLYQIAMDQMVQKVSTALQESLPQCAQEIRSQRRKMVSLQHAESCQHAQLIANSCHQNATEQDKWRALPNKMKVHLMLDKEITKLKKIKWKPNQLYQPVMDPMVQQKSTVWWKNRTKNQLLFNSKAITNTIIDTTTNIDKTKSQLQVNKETPKVRKIKWNLRELSQPVMEQMDQQKSTASHHQHQRQRALPKWPVPLVCQLVCADLLLNKMIRQLRELVEQMKTILRRSKNWNTAQEHHMRLQVLIARETSDLTGRKKLMPSRPSLRDLQSLRNLQHQSQ